MTGNSKPDLDAAKENFQVFLAVVWKYMLPQYKLTWTQKLAAKFLGEESGKVRFLIGYRGLSKTWITVIYIIWRLWKNPNEIIKIYSATTDFAIQSSEFALKIIKTVPFLAVLKPGATDKETGLAFNIPKDDIDREYSVSSVGIKGQTTGGRYTIALLDDIETANNADSVTKREKLDAQFQEIVFVGKEVSEIIGLGTPHFDDSLYHKLPAQGAKIVCIPAEVPKSEEQADEYYGPYLAKEVRDLIGKEIPEDYTHYSGASLHRRKSMTGDATYARQMMVALLKTDKSLYKLHLEDCLWYSISDNLAPSTIEYGGLSELRAYYPYISGPVGTKLFEPRSVTEPLVPITNLTAIVDPSGEGQDEMVVAIGGVANGLIYLLSIEGWSEGSTERVIKSICQKCRKYKVRKLIFENNFDPTLGKIFQSTFIDMGYQCEVVGERSTQQKEMRICQALEPVIKPHRLVFTLEALVEDYTTTEKYPIGERPLRRLTHQMSHIKPERKCLEFDDRVDALGKLTSTLSPFLGVSPSAQTRDRLAEAMKAEERQWAKLWKDNKRKSKVGLRNPQRKGLVSTRDPFKT